MARQTLIPKKRGPAPRGATAVMVRIEPGLLRALDAWIEGHADDLTRPAAIRKIVATRLRVPEAGP